MSFSLKVQIAQSYSQALRANISNETADFTRLIIDALLAKATPLAQIAETVYARGMNPYVIDSLYNLTPGTAKTILDPIIAAIKAEGRTAVDYYQL